MISLLGIKGFGQSHHLQLPAGYQSIAAVSRLQADAFSALHHPAVLSNLRAPVAGFFAEQRYLIPGLNYAGIGIGIPLQKGALGFCLQHLGGPEAGRLEAGFSTARQLGTYAALGIQFRYLSSRAAGYASENHLGYIIGTQLRVWTNVQAAISLGNPHQVFRSSPEKGAESESYHFALGTDVSESLFLIASIDKETGVSPAVIVAMQYRFAQRLLSRIAIGSGTGSFYLGCGYLMGRLRLDVFTSLHPQLGLSPGLQLLLMPKEKE